jgi:hypothetical protein
MEKTKKLDNLSVYLTLYPYSLIPYTFLLFTFYFLLLICASICNKITFNIFQIILNPSIQI